MVWEKDNKNYLVGVVSWGIKCAVGDVAGVYTEVRKYKNWIKKHALWTNRKGKGRRTRFCMP